MCGALTGRVALVTGSAGGIGHATADTLAQAGCAVFMLDLDRSVSQVATGLAKRHQVSIRAIHTDVADEQEIKTAFEQIEMEFGRLDILVNNAGIMPPHMVTVSNVAMADFDAMLRVHLRGAYLCAQHAVPLMKARSFGRIVNLSSVLGILGLPNRSAYAVAKTGVLGLTRSLAMEGGRYGITANAVIPGWILTERLRQRMAEGMLDYARYAARTPVGRWGEPSEVARLIRFLTLPDSEFITGATFPVDGGYCVRGDADEDIGPLPENTFNSPAAS